MPVAIALRPRSFHPLGVAEAAYGSSRSSTSYGHQRSAG